jgi:hypothetical protein
MKDSARRVFETGLVLALAATLLSVAACGRSSKASDVAQDSILVKDADVEHKTDTAGAATAALVRERGATPAQPTLTAGAPVQRSANTITTAPTTTTGAISTGTLQPPRRVNPSPVLPPRESTSTRRDTPTTPLSPQPVTTPRATVQPVSPQPPPVIQPSPVPKKDSSGDTLTFIR